MRSPVSRSARAARRAWPVGAAVSIMLCLGACSSSGGGGDESVFHVAVGQCFTTPTAVKAELSDLHRVSCSTPHTEESYAAIRYHPAETATSTGAPTSSSVYPGATALTAFAKGQCAQQFTSYVGIDYLDSSLFFTYLLPSARSWEESDDRTVLCFITTTGSELTGSVRNSKR